MTIITPCHTMRLSGKIWLLSLFLSALAFQVCHCDESLLKEDDVEWVEEELSSEDEVEEQFSDGSSPPLVNVGETGGSTADHKANTGKETDEVTEEEVPSGAQKPNLIPAAELQVISLTSSTFSMVTGDNNVWLIEFAADWCTHCVSFANTYAEIARHYHSQPQLKVKVAKVNVDQERALALRFGVHSFPSFYLIDGWSAYTFDHARSKKNLIDFASGGYKKQAAMPFYSSPMGPLGLAQGMLMNGGLRLSGLFYWLQERFGLSSLVAGTLMFGSFFLGCFFCIVFCAIAFTPKVKLD